MKLDVLEDLNKGRLLMLLGMIVFEQENNVLTRNAKMPWIGIQMKNVKNTGILV